MRVYATEPAPTGVVVEGSAEEAGVVASARASLDGRRRGLFRFLPFIGPAFIASVAYIDPGNYATNIQGGSAFGYNLLWVILLANLMAMLLQSLSVKLGVATGRNLAEMSREQFRRPVVYGMWVVSEIAAMATDLAEFLGASIALNLLFGIPLAVATLDHRRVNLSDSAPAGTWIPSPGGGDYRAGRRDCRLLPHRNGILPS